MCEKTPKEPYARSIALLHHLLPHRPPPPPLLLLLPGFSASLQPFHPPNSLWPPIIAPQRTSEDPSAPHRAASTPQPADVDLLHNHPTTLPPPIVVDTKTSVTVQLQIRKQPDSPDAGRCPNDRPELNIRARHPSRLISSGFLTSTCCPSPTSQGSPCLTCQI